MQFASRQRRMMWRNIGLTFLLDIAIAAGLAIYFAGDDWLLATVIIYIAIEAAALILTLRKNLAMWVIGSLGGTREQEASIVDALHQMKLPAPEYYEQSPEQYLARIADDTSRDPDMRVRAAVLNGALQGVSPRMGFVEGVMAAGAWERALAEYRREKTR